MEKVLKELHAEISRELDGDHEMAALGTPSHQLKMEIEGFLEEIEHNDQFNPFDMTNRVLRVLSQFHRL